MANFKIKLLTLHSDTIEGNLKVLSQNISEFNNFYEEIPQRPGAFSINTDNSFCYTYDEKFSIHKNAQKDLSFKMDRYITRNDRIEENPFVYNVINGSLILLIDKEGRHHLFTVTKRSYTFKENNLIVQYTCQDSFTYQLTRQNSGYTIENNPEESSYKGAHNVDWWVEKYIQPDCHIAYNYLRLADGLYQKGNLISILPINSIDNDGIFAATIKTPLSENSQSSDYFESTATGYYTTIPFSASGTSNSVLISLGEQVGLILNTFEFLNEETNTLYRYYWFEPEKSDKITGLKYSPYSDIQNFSISHDGTSVSTILNVQETKIDDDIITLFPKMPNFFQQWIINNEEWENIPYGENLFLEACKGKEYYLNKDFDTYKIASEISLWGGGAPVMDDSKWETLYFSEVSTNNQKPQWTIILNNYPFARLGYAGIFISLYNFIYSCKWPNLYKKIIFANTKKKSIFQLSKENAQESKDINNLSLIWNILFRVKETINNEDSWTQYLVKENENIPQEVLSAPIENIQAFLFIEEAREELYDNGSLKYDLLSSWDMEFFYTRDYTDEEIEWALVADECPWLENKLIDFGYFYTHNIINKQELKTLQNLIFEDLRKVNGRFMVYSQQYYAALHAKTKLMADLSSKLDFIGASFESDIISIKQNKSAVSDATRFNNFQVGYESLFSTASSNPVPILGLHEVLDDYVNKYINTEQRFLKNIYEFRRYFNEPISFLSKDSNIYTYKLSLTGNWVQGNFLYSLSQSSKELLKLNSNFNLYVMNEDEFNYGAPLVPIYRSFVRNGKTEYSLINPFTKADFGRYRTNENKNNDRVMKLYKSDPLTNYLPSSGPLKTEEEYYGYNFKYLIPTYAINDVKEWVNNEDYIITEQYDNSDYLTGGDCGWKLAIEEINSEEVYLVFKNSFNIFNEKMQGVLVGTDLHTYKFKIDYNYNSQSETWNSSWELNIKNLILNYEPLTPSEIWHNFLGNVLLILKEIGDPTSSTSGNPSLWNSRFNPEGAYVGLNSVCYKKEEKYYHLANLNTPFNDRHYWVTGPLVIGENGGLSYASLLGLPQLKNSDLCNDLTLYLMTGNLPTGNTANRLKWLYKSYFPTTDIYYLENNSFLPLHMVNKDNALSYYRRISVSKPWKTAITVASFVPLGGITQIIRGILELCWRYGTTGFDTDGYSYQDIFLEHAQTNGFADYPSKDNGNWLYYIKTINSYNNIDVNKSQEEVEEDGQTITKDARYKYLYDHIGLTYSNLTDFSWTPSAQYTPADELNKYYYQSKAWRIVQSISEKVNPQGCYYLLHQDLIRDSLFPIQITISEDQLIGNAFDFCTTHCSPKNYEQSQSGYIPVWNTAKYWNSKIWYPLEGFLISADFSNLGTSIESRPVTWQEVLTETFGQNSFEMTNGLIRSVSNSGQLDEHIDFFYIVQKEDFFPQAFVSPYSSGISEMEEEVSFINPGMSLKDIAEISYNENFCDYYNGAGVSYSLTKDLNYTNGLFIQPDYISNWEIITSTDDFDLKLNYGLGLNERNVIRQYTIKNLILEPNTYYNLSTGYSTITLQNLSKISAHLYKYDLTSGKLISDEIKEWNVTNEGMIDNITYSLVKTSQSIGQQSNGSYWYNFKDSDIPELQNFAILIESNLEEYWNSAYNASKFCHWYLPEHWQLKSNNVENNFASDICYTFTDENHVKLLLKETYIPLVTIAQVAPKYLIRSYSSMYEYQQILNNILREGLEKQDVISLNQLCLENSTINSIFNRLKLNMNSNIYWAAIKQYNNFTYYKVVSGGSSYQETFEQITNLNNTYTFLGGWCEMAVYALLNSFYIDQKLPLYEKALEDHNEIWRKIYTLYPGVLLEQSYKNDNVSSSRELLKMAKIAFDGYKNLETQYNITIIDLNHLKGYQGVDLKIGMPIEVDAEEYYDEFDDIKRSLQQYLYITDLSYSLRQDKDISITVNTIKYQDKVIKELIRLIR